MNCIDIRYCYSIPSNGIDALNRVSHLFPYDEVLVAAIPGIDGIIWLPPSDDDNYLLLRQKEYPDWLRSYPRLEYPLRFDKVVPKNFIWFAVKDYQDAIAMAPLLDGHQKCGIASPYPLPDHTYPCPIADPSGKHDRYYFPRKPTWKIFFRPKTCMSPVQPNNNCKWIPITLPPF